MQIHNTVEAGRVLLFDCINPEHEPVLQRMARRVDAKRWVTSFKLETCNLLRRMGYNPPDVFENYKFRGKFEPYIHQVETTKFLVNTYRGWCLNGMRSGKTLSNNWAIDCLMSYGEVKRALIIAPLSIVETSWSRELSAVNAGIRIYVANKSLRDLREKCDNDPPDVIIINPAKLQGIINWLCKKFDPELVIVDEATDLKGLDTERAQAFDQLMAKQRRLWLNTGTPCPNGPMDVYNLARYVNPNVPETSRIWQKETQVNINGSKWANRPGWEQKVADILHPAIRYRTQDCIDMPPQTYQHIDVPLSKEQKQAYNDMMQHMMVHTDKGNVTAPNAAVKIMKLLQICGGVVLDGDKKPLVLGAKQRLAECKRLIDQAEGKTIIVSPFTDAQEYIYDNLSRYYKCVIVNGDVKGKARTDVFDSFQDPNGPRVLIAHPAVIQFGLTLSAASMTIWWTGTFSTTQFIQANERMRGPDTHKTGVYMLQATPTEKRVYRGVMANESSNNFIADLFLNILNSGEKV